MALDEVDHYTIDYQKPLETKTVVFLEGSNCGRKSAVAKYCYDVLHRQGNGKGDSVDGKKPRYPKLEGLGFRL